MFFSRSFNQELKISCTPAGHVAIEVGELSDGQEKGENKKSGPGQFLWLFLWLLGFRFFVFIVSIS